MQTTKIGDKWRAGLSDPGFAFSLQNFVEDFTDDPGLSWECAYEALEALATELRRLCTTPSPAGEELFPEMEAIAKEFGLDGPSPAGERDGVCMYCGADVWVVGDTIQVKKLKEAERIAADQLGPPNIGRDDYARGWNNAAKTILEGIRALSHPKE